MNGSLLNSRPMSCKQANACFSGYLDGAITGREMQAVSTHLEGCSTCTADFAALRGMQQMLGVLGPIKPPADLALKLRLAVSHESARREGRLWMNLSTRWNNLLRPMLLQAGAGLASAVLLLGTIGILAGFVTTSPVQANDEPLGALTVPHYLYTAAQAPAVSTPDGSSLVVEADINAEGRIYDWHLISGSADQQTLAQVRDSLMLAVYQPALAFGQPVRGRVLVTFSGVSVKG